MHCYSTYLKSSAWARSPLKYLLLPEIVVSYFQAQLLNKWMMARTLRARIPAASLQGAGHNQKSKREVPAEGPARLLLRLYHVGVLARNDMQLMCTTRFYICRV